jgi:hypothetical protein
MVSSQLESMPEPLRVGRLGPSIEEEQMASIGTPHGGFPTGGVHYAGLGFALSACGGDLSSSTATFKTVTCKACKSKLRELATEILRDVSKPKLD